MSDDKVTVLPRFEMRNEGVLFPKWLLDQKAEFAKRLICQNALITAQDGGEDSAGRAKLRRETPAEVVSYACEVADIAFEVFKDRGWLMVAPTVDDITGGPAEKEAEKSETVG